ncbi:MAG TPA: hypothetical protein VF519_12580 [Mycobacteriales bacterium]|jgi:hypothetical protein
MLRLLLAGGVAVASLAVAAPRASAVCSLPLYYATGHCDVCSLTGLPWLECVQ